jgi:predicted DsbA family dithiol-disulfide isomerase
MSKLENLLESEKLTMIKVLVTLGLLSSTTCIFAYAEASSDPTPSSNTVLVEVDGMKLTTADLEQKRPGGLFHARNTYYEGEKKAVDELVDLFLIERQAKKENLTVPQLWEKHVISMLPKDPPEDTLKVYYEGVDTKQPYEAVRDQILANIREKRMQKARSTFLESLHSQANIVMHLSAPRAQVSMRGTPVRGKADAPVMIVEYADYECAYCQQMQPTIDKIEAEYKNSGKIAFAYKDTPLPMHPHAAKAAEAALCAGDQGKYWEMHDMMFATKQLDVDQLKEDAQKAKLDMSAFNKCLDSGAKTNQVKENLAEGQNYQLQGTPTFFINGRNFSGVLSLEQMRATIEEELAAASKGAKDTAKR